MVEGYLVYPFSVYFEACHVLNIMRFNRDRLPTWGKNLDFKQSRQLKITRIMMSTLSTVYHNMHFVAHVMSVFSPSERANVQDTHA